LFTYLVLFSISLVPPSYYPMSRKYAFKQSAARHKQRMGYLTVSLHNCHRRWILSRNRLPDRLEAHVRYEVYKSGSSAIWWEALPLAPLHFAGVLFEGKCKLSILFKHLHHGSIFQRYAKDCHNGISQRPSQTSRFDNSCSAANCYQWPKWWALPLIVPALLGQFDVKSTLAISVDWNTYEALRKPCVQYGTSSIALTLEACAASSVTYPTARIYSNSVILTGPPAAASRYPLLHRSFQ
jgi:hypothetical protein